MLLVSGAKQEAVKLCLVSAPTTCNVSVCHLICLSVVVSACLPACSLVCQADYTPVCFCVLPVSVRPRTNREPHCRYPPVCIDAETIIKGVEEGQLAVRRALTPYAGSVPPAATSDSPQGSSRATEIDSLDSLKNLAAAELSDDSLSSGDESGDDGEADGQLKLQEQYEFLLQQRAALQEQLEKLQQGK